jgi:NOL1/NOP2/fmu family ribosome biogenesis protein
MTRRVREVRERFGIPREAFGGLAVIEDQETVFVGTPEVMEFDAVRPMRRGIRLARMYPYSLKPTTFGMQVLGRQATRNVVELSDEQVRRLIYGESLNVEAGVENGFVLLKWQGFVAGVGFYKRPVLKSQIPRFRPVEQAGNE